MAAISIYILVVLGVTCLVALIAVLANYLKYKRHVSRVMNGEEAPSEKRISSPGETALAIFIILMLIWNGFALVQFSILNNDLDNMQRRMNEISRDLTIYTNDINEQIARGSSLVRDSRVVQGDIDSENLNFVMDFEVRLKEFTDSTEVYLNYGNRRVRMERSGDTYTAPMTVGLGEYVFDFATVEIINNGVTRIDTIYDTPTGPIWRDFLPEVYASKLPWDVKQKEGSVTIKDEMKFRLLERSESVSLKKAYLVTELNGSEIARQEIAISGTDDEVTIPFGKTYDLKDGEVLAFYSIAESDIGLSFKTLLVTYAGKGGDATDLPCMLLLDENGSVMFSE